MQLSPGTSRRRLVDPTQPPTLIEPETAVLWAGATVAGSRPASPAQPSLHYATDTPAVTLWDGSTWRSMGGATLPSASAAGQMLLSTGSGTSYAARARVLSGTLAERDALSPVREGDQWYVSSGASSGTFWQRVNGAWQFRPMGTSADAILDVLGGIKAPTSPTAGHVLTYDGSVWQSAAPTSSGGVTYTLGGSPEDYTAASGYALSGVTVISGAPSTRLGDGTSVPYFHVLNRGVIAALARNSDGLRMTHATANSATHSYPYAAGGATIRIPLARTLGDVQVDLRIAMNLAATPAAGGTDLIATFTGLCRAQPLERDYTLGGIWIISSYPSIGSGTVLEYAYCLAAQAGYRSDDTVRDISSSGEGTTGGVTVRDVRVIVRGAVVEVWTCAAGGTLTRRIAYTDPELVEGRNDLCVIASIAQNQATPQAGYYVELRALVITPL